MATSTELPMHLFVQRASAFCSSINTDLDEFVEVIENEFSSINREIKIAPKLGRKKLFETPGSCTLDTKEFTRSKENALHNMKANFEDLENKWANDVAELKDWFLNTVESCLAKIQLEIKLTAEDLNIQKQVPEVDLCEEDSSSSTGEYEEPVKQSRTRQSLGINTAASTPTKRVTQSNRRSFSDSAAIITPSKSATPRNSKKRERSHTSPSPSPSTSKKAKVETKNVRFKRTINVTEFDQDEAPQEHSVLDSSSSEEDTRSRTMDWKSLVSGSEEAPSKPGVYEIKVWKAKKPAYIGCTNDIKKKLQLHLDCKSSGNKHLDKFIERNKDEISVRYEACPSETMSVAVQKKKLVEFNDLYKTSPSYNPEL